MCAKAVEWIKNICPRIQGRRNLHRSGSVSILDFGAFVELTPGNDGMVHVSKLAPYRVGSPADLFAVGQMVTVKIDEIDDQGRINLSMKDCKENEPLWVDRKGEQKGDFGGGFRPRREFRRPRR